MTFLVGGCTFQDFVETQLDFAPSHDGETVTFRNSVRHSKRQFSCAVKKVLSFPLSFFFLIKEEILLPFWEFDLYFSLFR